MELTGAENQLLFTLWGILRDNVTVTTKETIQENCEKNGMKPEEFPEAFSRLSEKGLLVAKDEVFILSEQGQKVAKELSKTDRYRVREKKL